MLLVSFVSPLRGLVLRVNSYPPLPRWATLFRPWRDWREACVAPYGACGCLADVYPPRPGRGGLRCFVPDGTCQSVARVWIELSCASQCYFWGFVLGGSMPKSQT